jgi:predicted PurR-regulated permease PerM
MKTKDDNLSTEYQEPRQNYKKRRYPQKGSVQKNLPQAPVSSLLIVFACMVIIIAGMRTAGTILVPFLLAIFLAAICSTPLLWLRRKRVPTALAVGMILLGIASVGTTILALMGTSLQEFLQELPSYQTLLREKTAGLIARFQNMGVPITNQDMLNYFDPGKAMTMIADTLNGFRRAFSNAFMIIITMIFILLEASTFPDKLRAALGKAQTSFESLNKITEGIKSYLILKTLTSLLTGVLITVWLTFCGVKYAILWGVLAFLLNYVPTIGSIIAAIPAVLMAFIQAGPGTAAAAILGYLLANTIVSYVIEPKLMGAGVGLSPLVVFLSLIFWGWVFGPVGMLISVPLTMCVRIALETRKETLWIAILLGNKAAARASQ